MAEPDRDFNANLGTYASMGAKMRPLVDEASDERPVMTPEAAAERMIESNEWLQTGKKQKLTWSDRDAYRTPDGRRVKKDKKRGLLDRRLGFGKFPGGYWVQNLRVVLSNGQEVALQDVPEEITVQGRGPDQKGLVERVPLRELIANFLERMRLMALEENPLMCEFCYYDGAKDIRAKARHIKEAHPERFDAWLGPSPSEGPPTEPAPAPEPEPSPPKPATRPRGRPPKPKAAEA